MQRSALTLLLLTACTSSPPALDAAPTDAFVPPDAFVAIDAAPPGDAGLDARALDAFEPSDAGPLPSELAFVATFLGGLSVFRVESSGALTPVDGSPFDPHAHYYAVAVDPSVHFAYAADLDAGDIVPFRIEASGSLTALTRVHVEGAPAALAMAPDGHTLYVGLSESMSILAMSIGADGTLTSGATTTLSATLAYLTFGGDTLYASLGAGISVLTIDATGLHVAPGSPFAASAVFAGGIAIDPTHTFLLNARFALNGLRISGDSLAPVDGSPFTAFPASADPSATSVAFDPSGHFAYAIDTVHGALQGVAVDASAGTLEVVPGSPFTLSTPYSVAIDPTGRFLYVASDSGSILAFGRDAHGTLTPTVPGSPFPLSGLQPEISIVAR